MAENEPIIPDAVQPVLAVLENAKVPYEYKAFESSAKSAKQAADLIGCPLGAIVKSLFFVTKQSGEYLLVLASGENRVSSGRIKEQLQQPAIPTDARTVLNKTGFPVGGVPPFGHKTQFPVYMDQDLMQYDRIWASAGAIHSVMGMTPQDLLRLSDAKLCEVREA